MIIIELEEVSKVGNLSWGWLEDSFFNNYYTDVLEKVLLNSLDWSFPFNAGC